MTVQDPAPAPIAPPAPLPRVAVPAAPPPAAPQVPPAVPPGTPAAPPLGGIEPPQTITIPAEGALPELTLEQEAEKQAAAEAAAGAPPVTPLPGAEVPLPEGMGDEWKGKSAGDLLKALKDTQAALTVAQQAAPPVPQVPVPQPPPVTPPAPADDPYSKFNAAVETYAPILQAQGGKLTEQQVAAFAAHTGIPPEAVQMSLEGAVMKAEQQANVILKDIGGPTHDAATGRRNYDAMVAWMERNVSRDNNLAFNQALDSGDEGMARMAVQGMFTAFQAAGGGAPEFVAGIPPGGPGGVAPFTSQAEVSAFLNVRTTDGLNYRYDVDTTYQREYEARMAASVNPFG